MGQRYRGDEPGMWHHVINRGIAKRPLFEDKIDVRFFLSRLAKEVRRGRIEVHAYCLLTTHFHLLVKSLVGQLSEGMRRVQNDYSRTFNRRHHRDGTLIRGRFMSRPIESDEYLENVLRYIDINPVAAGLAQEPWDYPWGSAAHYVHGRGPSWLTRGWVEQEACDSVGASEFSPRVYRQAMGRGMPEGARWVVEKRAQSQTMGADNLDDLVGAAPARARAWMVRKALLADGCKPGLPVCDTKSIRLTVELAAMANGEWILNPAARSQDGWAIAEAGLLRILAGLTVQRIVSTV
ncbi:MAG: REP element-mobilizing transposase RayT, partial [Planctomycetota bacterium]